MFDTPYFLFELAELVISALQKLEHFLLTPMDTLIAQHLGGTIYEIFDFLKQFHILNLFDVNFADKFFSLSPLEAMVGPGLMFVLCFIVCKWLLDIVL